MSISIFTLLQDPVIQEQWKDICYIHNITKEYLLLAEEVSEEGKVFLQPLKEHRDAYDHVIRTFTIDIKELPSDFKERDYVLKNLQKAYGHEYRAFFDTADWLTYSLRKLIRIRIERMNENRREEYNSLLAEKGLKGLSEVIQLLNEYPYQIAQKRFGKDIVTAGESKDDIKEYTELMDELYKIYKATPF